MHKLERLGRTFKEIYIAKDQEKEIEGICKSIEMLKDKYDKAIVVLTGDFKKSKFYLGEEHTKMGFLAHIREAATALKYKELSAAGYHPVIITSGGRIYDKKLCNERSDAPMLSAAMKAELIQKYAIAEDDILIEPCSTDTSQNARFSSKLLDALGFAEEDDKSVYLITNRFHLSRATTLFNRYFSGNLESVDAEQMLIDFARQLSDGTIEMPYKKVVENYLNSPYGLKLARHDSRIHTITKLPFGEKFLETLAHYLRSPENKDKEEENPQ